MVARFPGAQRRERADNAFLADLHAATDAAVLQIDVAHECLRPGDDAGGRAAEEFVAGIKHEVGAVGEEARQIIFGCRVDDDWHAALMRDFGEYFQRDLGVVHDVVRDDIDGGGGALVDCAAQVIGRRAGRLPDWDDLGSGQPYALLDRCAVADHVAGLDDDFVLQAGRIRQPFDGGKIGAGHRGGDRQADRCRAGSGDEARLRAGEFGDDLAGAAMEVAHLDELGEDRRNRLDRLWNDYGSAERGHGSGDVDDRAEAKVGTDIFGRHSVRTPGIHELNE